MHIEHTDEDERPRGPRIGRLSGSGLILVSIIVTCIGIAVTVAAAALNIWPFASAKPDVNYEVISNTQVLTVGASLRRF